MARMLVVEDDPNVREALCERFRARGHDVRAATNVKDGTRELLHDPADVVLLDLRLPDGDGLSVLRAAREEGIEATVIVITAHGTLERAVEAMRQGAWDFLIKPFEPELVEESVRRALERTNLLRVVRAAARDESVVGLDGVMDQVRKAAASDATVLVSGESGTGKEVIAHAIHRASPRARAPFVAFNAGAIVESLAESELFGHERGAFTGADRRHAGRFELAHGGTLFLDEIGETTANVQVKLLRVLETRRFERVGGREPVSVDVRIVAATNRDLRQLVSEKRFREDLFWRLNVIPIQLAPLRERRHDIQPLARHFLAHLAPRKTFTSAALAALERHDWPGNARELRNAVERAAVLSEGDELDIDLLPPEVLAVTELAPASFHGQVEAFRARLLRDTLARHGGNQTRAAEALGLQRTYFARLLKQLGRG